jgi:hypothetical protein
MNNLKKNLANKVGTSGETYISEYFTPIYSDILQSLDENCPGLQIVKPILQHVRRSGTKKSYHQKIDKFQDV